VGSCRPAESAHIERENGNPAAEDVQDFLFELAPPVGVIGNFAD
jgi:hypothetical protein